MASCVALMRVVFELERHRRTACLDSFERDEASPGTWFIPRDRSPFVRPASRASTLFHH